MSDNELDKELLALAGGDGSSSEDEDIKPSSPARKAEPRERSLSDDRSPPPRRGPATKLKSRAKAKRNRPADSDDEGEA